MSGAIGAPPVGQEQAESGAMTGKTTIDATAGDNTELLRTLLARWKLLIFGPLVIGLAAVGASYLLTPSFTARTSFLPPQQQQSAAAGALASLGALGSLVGGGIGQRAPADQYVALLLSMTVADKLIDDFKLNQVYDKDLRTDARKQLAKNTRAVASKKDGLIVLEVDDEDPQRAADLANRYVEELRLLSNRLTLTEAQQRRKFFENHLQLTRDKLVEAQLALQTSGFTQESLKAEPKAAAEGYARLKAEITTLTAQLDALRGNLTESAPEVRQLEAMLGTLRGQLARFESTTPKGNAADYVGKFREFKYQEALFEQFSRQYELARVDESREGQLQVIDAAQAPEKKSWPKRSLFGAIGALAGFVLLLAWVLGAPAWRDALRRR